MVFLRRICSSRPGDGEQRGQSLAALTARGRGLDCLQPQPRQPVLRRNKLRIFRFHASAKAQPLRLFLLSPQSGHFVGAPIMARRCVSKQIGLPAVRFSLAGSSLPGRRARRARFPPCGVIRVAGYSVVWDCDPTLIFPKEHQKERCGHSRSQRSFITFSWCASEYSVVGRISCHDSYDSARTNVCQ